MGYYHVVVRPQVMVGYAHCHAYMTTMLLGFPPFV